MSDIQRDREERQHVIEVLQNMLDWMEAANMISSKPERIEAVKYAIASIKTDLKYDLLYEETLEEEPIEGHCKDCKYFEYDSWAKVNGMELIVAHEICSKWGRGCKTKENGYCFLFESKSEVEE